MIIACAAVLAVVVASPSPLPAAPTSQALVVAGTVTAQTEPKDSSTRRPTVCTEQYAPVCGRTNGVLKTYSNQCYARADGADAITQGPCAGPVIQPGPR
jgi:Kazal-type serine protease inhibitor domain